MSEAALDRLTPWVVGATIVAAALGSSIQRDLYDVGRPLRWLLVAIFFAFAVWRAAAAWPRWSLRRDVAVTLAVFCGLVLVSVGWSANVHATLGRAGLQLVILAGAAALAGCVAARPGYATRIVDGVVGAVALVAVGSAVYWLVSRGGAVQPASVEYPVRYRGLEQNPNTIAMLLAVGMPLAFARLLDATRRRAAYGALLLLFVVELAGSGSRGGLVAGFGALIVIAALAPLPGRTRLLAAAGAVAALVISAWISTLPKALPASAASAKPAAVHHVGTDAETVLPLMAEVGSPYWEHRHVSTKRRFFDASVRMRALTGSISRGLERPLLGWGYGAEIEAFLSRFYGFDSQNPENGYVGIFLQLGLIGLASLLLVLGTCAVAAVRAARATGDTARVAAAGAGAAGILLALSQSFFHGPGGIVFVAFWTSLLVAAAPVAAGDAARGPTRRIAP